MIYKFDKNSLTYKKVTSKLFFIMIGITLSLCSLASIIIILQVPKLKYLSSEAKAIIIAKNDQFTVEKLKQYLTQLNIRYPDIVLAQAEVETGNFTSTLFKENHNLFGFKISTARPTTNRGEQNGFAYYDNWRESVLDYALYSASYLGNIKTESQYLQYLGQNYDTQDSDYVSIIRKKLNEIKSSE